MCEWYGVSNGDGVMIFECVKSVFMLLVACDHGVDVIEL